MGYQQLLALLLAVVLVVIAVILGIDAFEANSKKSNADALLNDAVAIAIDAQRWMTTPTMLGGGGGACTEGCNWNGISFASLGYKTSETGSYENLHGVFFLDPSSRSSNLYVIGMNRDYGNRVVLTVRGVGPGRIVTQVQDMATAR